MQKIDIKNSIIKHRKGIVIYLTSMTCLVGAVKVADRGHEINSLKNQKCVVEIEQPVKEQTQEQPEKEVNEPQETEVNIKKDIPEQEPIKYQTPTIDILNEDTYYKKELDEQEEVKEMKVTDYFKTNLSKVTNMANEDDKPDNFKESFDRVFKQFIGTNYSDSNYNKSFSSLEEIIRYIYRNSEVNKIEFDNLAKKNKLEVLDTALAMNSIISQKWPEKLSNEEEIYSNSSNTLTTLSQYVNTQDSEDMSNDYYVLKTQLINNKKLIK